MAHPFGGQEGPSIRDSWTVNGLCPFPTIGVNVNPRDLLYGTLVTKATGFDDAAAAMRQIYLVSDPVPFARQLMAERGLERMVIIGPLAWSKSTALVPLSTDGEFAAFELEL